MSKKASQNAVQWPDNNVNYQASEANENQTYLLAEAFISAESINSTDINATLNAIVSNALNLPPNGLCRPEDNEAVEGPVMKPWDKAADEERQRDKTNFIATLDAMQASPLAAASYLAAKASGVEDSERLLGAGQYWFVCWRVICTETDGASD